MNQKGIAIIKTLLIIGVCAILLIINIFVYRDYQARNRDAIRIADMAVLQSAFNQLYTQQASYALNSECVPGNVMIQDQCNISLREFISIPSTLADPGGNQVICDNTTCGVESCQYTVGEEFTDESYRIYFTLERDFGELEAGCRYLDQEGLH